MSISQVADNHQINSRAHPNLWSRAVQRLEREGPSGTSPNSTSIQHLIHVLGEIHVGFSPIFILHAFSFLALERTTNLYLGDLIQRLWFFWLMDHEVVSLRSVIITEGVPPPCFCLQHPGRGEFPHFFIKATTLAFRTRYGEGVVPQNRQTKDLRP